MSESSQPPNERRPDASMTLISEVYARSLDPGYADRAARRKAGKHMGPPRSLRFGSLITGLLVGLVLSTAAVSLRAPTSPGQLARQALQEQITETHAVISERTATLQEYQTQVTRMENTLLESSMPLVLASLKDEEVLSGTAPAIGRGLVMTLTDPTESSSELPADQLARLTDFDLQLTINSLWAGGAEGISINGIRLTALSPIRSAGQVIMVDLLPTSGPYVIEAIGDPNQLLDNFNRSIGRHHIEQLQQLYGINNSTEFQDELILQAGWRTTLSNATANGEILGYASIPDEQTGRN